MNTTTNPTAIQSKNMLAASLIQLMESFPYEKITISQITGHADLSRRTFYRNFDTKDELLKYQLSNLTDEYLDRLMKLDHFTLEDSFGLFLTLCSDHSSFLLLLKKQNLLPLLLFEWTTALPKIHEKVLPKLTDFPKVLDDETLDYLLAFNSGGAFNIIIKWINDGMILPAKDLSKLVTVLKKARM